MHFDFQFVKFELKKLIYLLIYFIMVCSYPKLYNKM